MNTTARPNAASASDATHPRISTGERFPDGSVIEMIAGSPGSEKPRLLHWNGSAATVGSCVEHGGRVYEAPALDPLLQQAMRLPVGSGPYSSARDLFAQVRDLPARYLGLPESESGLFACFVFSTWLSDGLPSAPTLTIFGTRAEGGIELLRLLSCVCRRPLLLTELTAGIFRSLPTQLSPTLLLDQQRLKPSMQRLLEASSYRGLHLVRNDGRILDPCCSKAILSGDDAALDAIGSQVLRIALSPLRLQPSALDEQARDKIAHEFQPQLLMYRLKNIATMQECQTDVSRFFFATRPVARTLLRCFPEDPNLACDVVQLLDPQDEEVRDRLSRDVNYVVVEILLGLIHEQKQTAVRVKELAEDVNVLLRSRGEVLKFSPEEIGGRLRKMAIPRHKNSSGRVVMLNRDISRRVHHWAKIYELGGLSQSRCPDCSEAQSTVSEQLMEGVEGV